MTTRQKRLWFAPLAVLIEWTTFVWVVARYPMNFDLPLSSIPYFYPDFYPIFGVAITAVAVCIWLFSPLLQPFWEHAIVMTTVCGIAMIIGAWALYNPNGGFWHAVHANAISLAVIGYSFIILQVSHNAAGAYRLACRIFSAIAILGLVMVVLSIYVFQSYVAWFQLFLMLTVQAWLLYTAYYLWKRQPAIR